MFAEAGAFLITMVILHNYPDLCTSQFNLTLSSSLRLRALTWLSNDSSYSQVIFTPRAASSNLWYDPGSDCHQNSLQRGGCSYPWMFFFSVVAGSCVSSVLSSPWYSRALSSSADLNMERSTIPLTEADVCLLLLRECSSKTEKHWLGGLTNQTGCCTHYDRNLVCSIKSCFYFTRLFSLFPRKWGWNCHILLPCVQLLSLQLAKVNVVHVHLAKVNVVHTKLQGLGLFCPISCDSEESHYWQSMESLCLTSSK